MITVREQLELGQHVWDFNTFTCRNCGITAVQAYKDVNIPCEKPEWKQWRDATGVSLAYESDIDPDEP